MKEKYVVNVFLCLLHVLLIRAFCKFVKSVKVTKIVCFWHWWCLWAFQTTYLPNSIIANIYPFINSILFSYSSTMQWVEIISDVPFFKSVNLQYDMLVRWADGRNDSSTMCLMFQIIFFVIKSCKIHCKYTFNLFFYFLWNYKNENKEFWVP